MLDDHTLLFIESNPYLFNSAMNSKPLVTSKSSTKKSTAVSSTSKEVKSKKLLAYNSMFVGDESTALRYL